MEKVEKFWDRIASRYDAIERNDMAYRIFIEEARRYIKADDTVIDFGVVPDSSAMKLHRMSGQSML